LEVQLPEMEEMVEMEETVETSNFEELFEN